MTEAIGDNCQDDNRWNPGLITKMDNIVNEMLTTDSKTLTLEQLEELVLKVNMVVHQTREKLTRDVARVMGIARDKYLAGTLDGYRSKKVMYLSLATGGLHLLAGASSLAPGGVFKSATALNNAISSVSKGRVSGIIDLSRFDAASTEGLDKIGQAFASGANGLAQASASGQGILNDQRTCSLTENQSKSERHKLDKQEMDQEANQQGGRVDQAKQQRDQVIRQRYDTFVALTR